jgi:hypothetical protein
MHRDQNCYVFADSRWAFLPSLLLANGLISQIFDTLGRQEYLHSQYLCYLGISQWLSSAISELPETVQ